MAVLTSWNRRGSSEPVPRVDPSVRSWLYAPGHSEKLLAKVFEAGADAVILDLEDAVPVQLKAEARTLVAGIVRDRPTWVRINRPRTAEAEADLTAVGAFASGLRVPKVESAADVEWVAVRAPGKVLACTIESAVGVLRAAEIAAAPATGLLVLGAADLVADLGLGEGTEPLAYARSHLVVSSRAAGISPPCDSVYTGPDGAGLREAAENARRFGFGSKSAVRPQQVAVINEVFSPSPSELRWAREVLAVFDAAGGAATRLPSGALVDLPIATRARRLLALAER
jgi:citrate lyase subunit beta/citryl-CoA lyase